MKQYKSSLPSYEKRIREYDRLTENGAKWVAACGLPDTRIEEQIREDFRKYGFC